MTQNEELKAQYDEKYNAMRIKLCPYFKENCLMAGCIAFAGHCHITDTGYSITEPHCQMFQDTSLLYELAELSRCNYLEPQEERWKSIDDIGCLSSECRKAITDLREKHKLSTMDVFLL